MSDGTKSDNVELVQPGLPKIMSTRGAESAL